MADSPIVKQYMSYLNRPAGGGFTWGVGTLVGLAAFAFVFGVVAINSYTNPHVPAGHEGYIFERPRLFGKGGYRGSIAGPGNYGVSLWRNESMSIDMRPTTYTETFQILAKDDLNIRFDFQAVLAIEPGTVRGVVDEYGGENWYVRFVQAPFRTFIRETVQSHDSRSIKSERSTIAADVQSRLSGYLQETPFSLVSLIVGNVDYPDVVAKAVERKLAAQQVLEEMETQRAIARKDAEIRVEEAKGIAEAQKIINSTLTVNYLQHEAINAQREMADSPNHTTVYIPVGNNGIPLIQRARTAR
jgi:hypothetical protein